MRKHMPKVLKESLNFYKNKIYSVQPFTYSATLTSDKLICVGLDFPWCKSWNCTGKVYILLNSPDADGNTQLAQRSDGFGRTERE